MTGRSDRCLRVLIVDDSVVIRRLLADIIDGEDDMEAVGTASNGKLAIDKIERLDPDVVTLDVEMPVMDGIATLRALRQQGIAKPIIMFSTLTDRGAEATLDAMALGAADYVTKPSNTGGFEQSRERVRSELLPKIRALGVPRRPRSTGDNGATSPAVDRPSPPPSAHAGVAAGGVRSIDVVAVGCSTGGPNALAELIPLFPRSIGAPILLVQHMPPVFTGLLARRLDESSALRVVEAEHDMAVEADTVYIAPGDHHLTVRRDGLRVFCVLDQSPPVNSCRPAVDPLFASVAEVYGRKSLAIVLTGMGSDGLVGARAVKDANGQVFVQDQATSVIWGMPGAIAEAGLADAVLPLGSVAAAVGSRLRTRRNPTGAKR